MLSGGKSSLAMAPLCMKQRTTAVQNACGDEAAGMFVSTAEAKAPSKREEAANAVAVCPKSKSRDELLKLLNKPGAHPAAKRMALGILMKLVRRGGEKFDSQLFTRILCSLVKNRGSSLAALEFLASKSFVWDGTRCSPLDTIHEVAKRYLDDETRGIEVLRMLYGLVFGKDSLTSPDFEQKRAPERECRLLDKENLLFPLLLHATEHNDLKYEIFRVLLQQLTFSVLDSEHKSHCCKATVSDNALQEPDKTKVAEDISALVVTAARGSANETNSAVNVKAGAPKKKASEEDEVEDEEEEEGGESGGDEGDSDDPDHGGNGDEEGEEEEEEEEEDEDGEEEEEDGGQQVQQPEGIGSNAARNNIINSVGAGFEEEEESDQEGGVEDDGDEGDGDEGDGDEDDGEEDDEDGAPPKKKIKK